MRRKKKPVTRNREKLKFDNPKGLSNSVPLIRPSVRSIIRKADYVVDAVSLDELETWEPKLAKLTHRDFIKYKVLMHYKLHNNWDFGEKYLTRTIRILKYRHAKRMEGEECNERSIVDSYKPFRMSNELNEKNSAASQNMEILMQLTMHLAGGLEDWIDEERFVVENENGKRDHSLYWSEPVISKGARMAVMAIRDLVDMTHLTMKRKNMTSPSTRNMNMYAVAFHRWARIGQLEPDSLWQKLQRMVGRHKKYMPQINIMHNPASVRAIVEHVDDDDMFEDVSWSELGGIKWALASPWEPDEVREIRSAIPEAIVLCSHCGTVNNGGYLVDSSVNVFKEFYKNAWCGNCGLKLTYAWKTETKYVGQELYEFLFENKKLGLLDELGAMGYLDAFSLAPGHRVKVIDHDLVLMRSLLSRYNLKTIRTKGAMTHNQETVIKNWFPTITVIQKMSSVSPIAMTENMRSIICHIAKSELLEKGHLVLVGSCEMYEDLDDVHYLPILDDLESIALLNDMRVRKLWCGHSVQTCTCSWLVNSTIVCPRGFGMIAPETIMNLLMNCGVKRYIFMTELNNLDLQNDTLLDYDQGEILIRDKRIIIAHRNCDKVDNYDLEDSLQWNERTYMLSNNVCMRIETRMQMSQFRLREAIIVPEIGSGEIEYIQVDMKPVERFMIPQMKSTTLLNMIGLKITTSKIVPVNWKLLKLLCARNMTADLTYNDLLEYALGIGHAKYSTQDKTFSNYDVTAESARDHALIALVLSARQAIRAGNTIKYGKQGVITLEFQKLMMYAAQGIFKHFTNIFKSETDFDVLDTTIRRWLRMSQVIMNQFMADNVWDKLSEGMDRRVTRDAMDNRIDLGVMMDKPMCDHHTTQCTHSLTGPYVCNCCKLYPVDYERSLCECCERGGKCIHACHHICYDKAMHCCAGPCEHKKKPCSCCRVMSCHDPCKLCRPVKRKPEAPIDFIEPFTIKTVVDNKSGWIAAPDPEAKEEERPAEESEGEKIEELPEVSETLKLDPKQDHLSNEDKAVFAEYLVNFGELAYNTLVTDHVLAWLKHPKLETRTGEKCKSQMKGLQAGNNYLKRASFEDLQVDDSVSTSLDCGLAALHHIWPFRINSKNLKEMTGKAENLTTEDFMKIAEHESLNLCVITKSGARAWWGDTSDEEFGIIIHMEAINIQLKHWMPGYARQTMGPESVPVQPSTLSLMSLDPLIKMYYCQSIDAYQNLSKLRRAEISNCVFKDLEMSYVRAKDTRRDLCVKDINGVKVLTNNDAMVHNVQDSRVCMTIPDKYIEYIELMCSDEPSMRNSVLYNEMYNTDRLSIENVEDDIRGVLLDAVKQVYDFKIVEVDPRRRLDLNGIWRTQDVLVNGHTKYILAANTKLKEMDMVLLDINQKIIRINVHKVGSMILLPSYLNNMVGFKVKMFESKASVGSAIRKIVSIINDVDRMNMNQFKTVLREAEYILGVPGSGKSTVIAEEMSDSATCVVMTRGARSNLKNKGVRSNKVVVLERAMMHKIRTPVVIFDEATMFTIDQIYLTLTDEVKHVKFFGDQMQIGVVDMLNVAGSRLEASVFDLPNINIKRWNASHRLANNLTKELRYLVPELESNRSDDMDIKLLYHQAVDAEAILEVLDLNKPDCVFVFGQPMKEFILGLRTNYKCETIHSHQGWEYKNILVIQGTFKRMASLHLDARYCYACATRCTQKLTWLSIGCFGANVPLHDRISSNVSGGLIGWLVPRDKKESIVPDLESVETLMQTGHEALNYEKGIKLNVNLTLQEVRDVIYMMSKKYKFNSRETMSNGIISIEISIIVGLKVILVIKDQMVTVKRGAWIIRSSNIAHTILLEIVNNLKEIKTRHKLESYPIDIQEDELEERFDHNCEGDHAAYETNVDMPEGHAYRSNISLSAFVECRRLATITMAMKGLGSGLVIMWNNLKLELKAINGCSSCAGFILYLDDVKQWTVWSGYKSWLMRKVFLHEPLTYESTEALKWLGITHLDGVELIDNDDSAILVLPQEVTSAAFDTAMVVDRLLYIKNEIVNFVKDKFNIEVPKARQAWQTVNREYLVNLQAHCHLIGKEIDMTIYDDMSHMNMNMLPVKTTDGKLIVWIDVLGRFLTKSLDDMTTAELMQQTIDNMLSQSIYNQVLNCFYTGEKQIKGRKIEGLMISLDKHRAENTAVARHLRDKAANALVSQAIYDTVTLYVSEEQYKFRDLMAVHESILPVNVSYMTRLRNGVDALVDQWHLLELQKNLGADETMLNITIFPALPLINAQWNVYSRSPNNSSLQAIYASSKADSLPVLNKMINLLADNGPTIINATDEKKKTLLRRRKMCDDQLSGKDVFYQNVMVDDFSYNNKKINFGILLCSVPLIESIQSGMFDNSVEVIHGLMPNYSALGVEGIYSMRRIENNKIMVMYAGSQLVIPLNEGELSQLSKTLQINTGHYKWISRCVATMLGHNVIEIIKVQCDVAGLSIVSPTTEILPQGYVTLNVPLMNFSIEDLKDGSLGLVNKKIVINNKVFRLLSLRMLKAGTDLETLIKYARTLLHSTYYGYSGSYQKLTESAENMRLAAVAVYSLQMQLSDNVATIIEALQKRYTRKTLENPFELIGEELADYARGVWLKITQEFRLDYDMDDFKRWLRDGVVHINKHSTDYIKTALKDYSNADVRVVAVERVLMRLQEPHYDALSLLPYDLHKPREHDAAGDGYDTDETDYGSDKGEPKSGSSDESESDGDEQPQLGSASKIERSKTLDQKDEPKPQEEKVTEPVIVQPTKPPTKVMPSSKPSTSEMSNWRVCLMAIGSGGDVYDQLGVYDALKMEVKTIVLITTIDCKKYLERVNFEGEVYYLTPSYAEFMERSTDIVSQSKWHELTKLCMDVCKTYVDEVLRLAKGFDLYAMSAISPWLVVIPLIERKPYILNQAYPWFISERAPHVFSNFNWNNKFINRLSYTVADIGMDECYDDIIRKILKDAGRQQVRVSSAVRDACLDVLTVPKQLYKSCKHLPEKVVQLSIPHYSRFDEDKEIIEEIREKKKTWNIMVGFSSMILPEMFNIAKRVIREAEERNWLVVFHIGNLEQVVDYDYRIRLKVGTIDLRKPIVTDNLISKLELAYASVCKECDIIVAHASVNLIHMAIDRNCIPVVRPLFAEQHTIANFMEEQEFGLIIDRSRGVIKCINNVIADFKSYSIKLGKLIQPIDREKEATNFKNKLLKAVRQHRAGQGKQRKVPKYYKAITGYEPAIDLDIATTSTTATLSAEVYAQRIEMKTLLMDNGIRDMTTIPIESRGKLKVYDARFIVHEVEYDPDVVQICAQQCLKYVVAMHAKNVYFDTILPFVSDQSVVTKTTLIKTILFAGLNVAVVENEKAVWYQFDFEKEVTVLEIVDMGTYDHLRVVKGEFKNKRLRITERGVDASQIATTSTGDVLTSVNVDGFEGEMINRVRMTYESFINCIRNVMNGFANLVADDDYARVFDKPRADINARLECKTLQHIITNYNRDVAMLELFTRDTYYDVIDSGDLLTSGQLVIVQNSELYTPTVAIVSDGRTRLYNGYRVAEPTGLVINLRMNIFQRKRFDKWKRSLKKEGVALNNETREILLEMGIKREVVSEKVKYKKLIILHYDHRKHHANDDQLQWIRKTKKTDIILPDGVDEIMIDMLRTDYKAARVVINRKQPEIWFESNPLTAAMLKFVETYGARKISATCYATPKFNRVSLKMMDLWNAAVVQRENTWIPYVNVQEAFIQVVVKATKLKDYTGTNEAMRILMKEKLGLNTSIIITTDISHVTDYYAVFLEHKPGEVMTELGNGFYLCYRALRIYNVIKEPELAPEGQEETDAEVGGSLLDPLQKETTKLKHKITNWRRGEFEIDDAVINERLRVLENLMIDPTALKLSSLHDLVIVEYEGESVKITRHYMPMDVIYHISGRHERPVDEITDIFTINFWEDNDRTHHNTKYGPIVKCEIQSNEVADKLKVLSKHTMVRYPMYARPVMTKSVNVEFNAVSKRLGASLKVKQERINLQYEVNNYVDCYFDKSKLPLLEEFQLPENLLTYNEKDIKLWLATRPEWYKVGKELELLLAEGFEKNPLNKMNVHVKLESLLKPDPIRSYDEQTARIIVWQSKGYCAIMSPIFIEAKKRLKQMLNSKTLYIDGMTAKEISEWLSARPRPARYFSDDLSKQDCKTDNDLLDVEFAIYNLLGVDPDVLRVYRNIHDHWRYSGKYVRGVFNEMRATGEATTALGNFIVNGIVHSGLIKRNPDIIAMLGLGDDNLMLVNGWLDLQGFSKEVSLRYNMINKPESDSAYGNLCSLIVTGNEKGTNQIGPDFVRLRRRYEVPNGVSEVDSEVMNLRRMSYLSLLGKTTGTEELVKKRNLDLQLENYYNFETNIYALMKKYDMNYEQVLNEYNMLIRLLDQDQMYTQHSTHLTPMRHNR